MARRRPDPESTFERSSRLEVETRIPRPFAMTGRIIHWLEVRIVAVPLRRWCGLPLPGSILSDRAGRRVGSKTLEIAGPVPPDGATS